MELIFKIRSLFFAPIVFLFFMNLTTFNAMGQVGIGTTNPNASLEIIASNVATPANTDGILIPRIDEFPASNPTSVQDGMLVFATGNGTPAEGFYYWDNGTTAWVAIGGSGAQKIDDLTDGKSDSDGTNDGSSVFLGVNAGVADDSTDNRNVGIGYNSLQDNTTGISNVANGYFSLQNNTTGIENTAVGYTSLNSNVTGGLNTAIGSQALFSTTAGANTATGYRALFSNTAGSRNVASGMEALNFQTIGSDNVAIGYRAGFNNITGFQNVFIGSSAGFNTLGNGSVYLGYQAGSTNILGSRLYIENSNADPNNALIYGEFDNNILRTNSEFQIGNPTGTGYAFPTTDGTTGQVLSTNGVGQLSFTTTSLPEWIDGGSYLTPGDGIMEEVLIGTTTSADGKLLVFSGTKNAAIEVDFDGTADYGILISRSGSNIGLKYGIYNDLGGFSSSFTNWGTYNNITTSGNGVRIAIYNTVNSTGTGNKYATWNYIPISNPGTHYGIYSDVQKANGYAGYFLGRVSFGNTSLNRYLMPAADGTANQVLTTNGAGVTSWQNNSNSTFALAKIRMFSNYVHPRTGWVKQVFDAVTFDLGSNFNNTTTYRFEVTEAGYYRISGSFRSNANNATTNLFGVSIYVNGIAVKANLQNHHGNGTIIRTVESVEALNIGDYIEIYYYSTSTLTVNNSSLYSLFEVERIR